MRKRPEQRKVQQALIEALSPAVTPHRAPDVAAQVAELLREVHVELLATLPRLGLLWAVWAWETATVLLTLVVAIPVLSRERGRSLTDEVRLATVDFLFVRFLATLHLLFSSIRSRLRMIEFVQSLKSTWQWASGTLPT